MHTDEYEISIGREITFCRSMVRQLTNAIDRRAKQCRVTTPELLQAFEQGSSTDRHPVEDWQQEYQQLRYWQKMLADYEDALESLKGI